MKAQKFMPERFHFLDSNMSLEKILQAQENQSPLYGKVVFYKSSEKQLVVNLGNGYTGTIPVELASIYPILDDNGNLSASIRSIIGRMVNVTVLSVDATQRTPIITLSRKHNMVQAFENISNSVGKAVECFVTSVCSCGIFVDVGNGISGLIHYKNLCSSMVSDFSEIVKPGSRITAKILSVDDNFHVNLSYKDLFENLAYSLNPGDFIEAKLLYPINESGYFAYLNPNTLAVVDVPTNIPCKYGDKVVTIVKKTRPLHPDKLRLRFISFVD